jgi:hypothetical protein
MKNTVLARKVAPYKRGPGAKESRVVRQIIALRDFADVTAGTPGGWLENERSLSHDGDCWIYDENSLVYADARVEQRPRDPPCEISHLALISDNAWVDASHISHHARLSGHVAIQDSQVHGVCHLFGHARISDSCQSLAPKV